MSNDTLKTSKGAEEARWRSPPRLPAPVTPPEPVRTSGATKRISSHGLRLTKALHFNAQMLLKRHGLEHIGFATLTFRGAAPTPKKAQECFRKFRRNFLDKFRPDWIAVLEKGHRGRLHYHLLTALPFDATNCALWSGNSTKARLVTCSARLRAEWRLWRAFARKAGLGAVHGPMPVRRSIEALSEYLTAYIAKSLARRDPSVKHTKLALYAQSTRRQTTRTASNTPTAAGNRMKLKTWTRALWGDDAEASEWPDTFGKHWYDLFDGLPQKPQNPELLEVRDSQGRLKSKRRPPGRNPHQTQDGGSIVLGADSPSQAWPQASRNACPSDVQNPPKIPSLGKRTTQI